MPLLDSIQETIHKVLPQKKGSIPLQSSMTGGIGNGHAPFEDNVRVHFYFPLIPPSSTPFYLDELLRSIPSVDYISSTN